jgi:hypothetical protein
VVEALADVDQVAVGLGEWLEDSWPLGDNLFIAGPFQGSSGGGHFEPNKRPAQPRNRLPNWP